MASSAGGVETDSLRLQRARIRLFEAQGRVPIGTSSSLGTDRARLSQADVAAITSLATTTTGADMTTKVREMGWRVAEPAVKYDPEVAALRFFAKPATWIRRNIKIFVPLAIFALNVLFDILANQEQPRRRQRAMELLDIISAQSPALIKAGQALASRSDLLPSEYLESLQQLQDRCPPFPTWQATQLFKEETGRDFLDVFTLEREEPIAAASIGQVNIFVACFIGRF